MISRFSDQVSGAYCAANEPSLFINIVDLRFIEATGREIAPTVC